MLKVRIIEEENTKFTVTAFGNENFIIVKNKMKKKKKKEIPDGIERASE